MVKNLKEMFFFMHTEFAGTRALLAAVDGLWPLVMSAIKNS